MLKEINSLFNDGDGYSQHRIKSWETSIHHYRYEVRNCAGSKKRLSRTKDAVIDELVR